MIAALQSVVEHLDESQSHHIALLSYSNVVHCYDCSGGLSRPKMLVLAGEDTVAPAGIVTQARGAGKVQRQERNRRFFFFLLLNAFFCSAQSSGGVGCAAALARGSGGAPGVRRGPRAPRCRWGAGRQRRTSLAHDGGQPTRKGENRLLGPSLSLCLSLFLCFDRIVCEIWRRRMCWERTRSGRCTIWTPPTAAGKISAPRSPPPLCVWMLLWPPPPLSTLDRCSGCAARREDECTRKTFVLWLVVFLCLIGLCALQVLLSGAGAWRLRAEAAGGTALSSDAPARLRCRRPRKVRAKKDRD